MGIQINGQTDTVTAIDGSLNVGGDVTIPGVLTYDDVTNIDSVGVITARSGVHVTGGNVGIDTDNPTVKLDIVDSGSPNIALRGSSFPSIRYSALDGTTDAEIYYGISGNDLVLNNENAGPISLKTSNTERLRITGIGSVGIGTDDPDRNLHVHDGVIRVTNAAKTSVVELTTDGAIELNRLDGGYIDLGYSSSEDYHSRIKLESDGELIFHTGGSGGSQRLGITSTGDTEIVNTVVGVTNAYSQYLKFRTTQTNGQSAITGAIAAQGKSNWGGDLVFYTKESDASPGDTVRETLRIDTYGRITKPYQPRFFAYATSSVSVTSTGYQTVGIWNQTRFNIGNHFSTSTNKFVAPIAGCYLFGTQVRLDAANTGYFRLILSVNDSTADNEQGHSITDTGSTGDSYHTMAVTALYELSAGQSVKVVVEGNSDSSYTIQSESQFWGYLVA